MTDYEEIVRLRDVCASLRAERDTLKAAIEQLLTAIVELQDARPFDEWIDASSAHRAAFNKARAALATCVPPQETEK